jgi:multidrug efflux system membrane fusion protein
VISAAVGNDQNLNYLYVVNDQNQVERRNVTLGTEQEGLTVISEGLNAGDRVIVSGLQHVRPGMVVNPNLEDMPDPAANPARPTSPTDQAASQAKP